MLGSFHKTYEALRSEFGHFMTSSDLVDCGLFESIGQIRGSVSKGKLIPPSIDRADLKMFTTEGVIDYIKRFGEDRLYLKVEDDPDQEGV